VKFLTFTVKNNVMSAVDVDSRGRIYIPKEMREKHGEKFKIVELESGIKLIPVADDPVECLKQAMNGAEDIDIDNLSEEVEEAAKQELKEEFD